MTRKLIFKIDVAKINKSKITDRKFTNKEGVEKVAKEYGMEIVILDTPTLIKEYDESKFMKIGFVAEGLTKEERTAKVKRTILGDVCEFVSKVPNEEPLPDPVKSEDTGDISPDEIPW